MSQSENFIDEVTDDLRRDRLFAAFRKYGWIGVLLVLGVVGGTAWTEYTKARDAARAQDFGDAVLDALDLGAPADRHTALAAAPAQGAQRAVLDLLLASDPEQDRAGTLEALTRLAADQTQPQGYRDLATLRRVIVGGADIPLAERRSALDSIAVPGRAFRTLALEQVAYLQVEEGRKDEAIATLRALTRDQEAPAGLRGRAEQMIVALGGDTPADAG